MRNNFMLAEEIKNGDVNKLDLEDYFTQIKLDGERVKLFYDKDKIVLLNRHSNFCDAEFPEIRKAKLKCENAVLDGEIVCPTVKARDRPSTAERINRTNKYEVEMLSRVMPACYMAFDVLEVNGNPLYNVALRERLKVLSEVVVESDVIEVVPCFNSLSEAWKQVEENNEEGVMLKRKDSVYSFKRSRDWLKLKNWVVKDFEVIGYTTNKREISAFRLKGGFKVNCSLNESEYGKILPQIKELVTGEDKEGTLIKPDVYKATVRYLTKANGLRFPVLEKLEKKAKGL